MRICFSVQGSVSTTQKTAKERRCQYRPYRQELPRTSKRHKIFFAASTNGHTSTPAASSTNSQVGTGAALAEDDAVWDELVFMVSLSPQAIRRRIVPAVALAAHRRAYPVGGESGLKRYFRRACS